MSRAWKLVITLSCAGLLWCIAVGLLLWFLPLGSSTSTSSSGTMVADGGQSFSSISGLGPLPLIIPLVFVSLGTWSALRHRKHVLVAATALLALFVFLTGLSIGLAYLPAVAALVVACIIAFSASGNAPRVGAH
jgi:hypothetical protein